MSLEDVSVNLGYDTIELPWLVLKGIQLSLIRNARIGLYSFSETQNATLNKTMQQVIAPVDGKVVVIEEVEETEYFKEKRTTGQHFHVTH